MLFSSDLTGQEKHQKPDDDIKSARGEIYNGLKQVLGLTQCGNSADSFLRDTMAPLITPDTEIYKQLEQEIFGEQNSEENN